MSYSALCQTLKDLYKKEKGERFFSFSLLWSCLCEKNGISSMMRFSQEPCPPAWEQALIEEAKMLLAGYPLQYYLGKWEFRGKDYYCREGVLIPREDTGILCECCEALLPPRGKLIDFCCGSGIVGIDLLSNRPDCTGIAADVSPHALRLTGENAALHQVDSRLQVRKLDLFSSETEKLLAKEAPHVFACNPPYIPTKDLETLEENVKREPSLSLDGGEDGLRFYRRIWELALRFPRIAFACEIGFDQREALLRIFGQAPRTPRFYKDRSDNDRVFVFETLSS